MKHSGQTGPNSFSVDFPPNFFVSRWFDDPCSHSTKEKTRCFPTPLIPFVLSVSSRILLNDHWRFSTGPRGLGGIRRPGVCSSFSPPPFPPPYSLVDCPFSFFFCGLPFGEMGARPRNCMDCAFKSLPLSPAGSCLPPRKVHACGNEPHDYTDRLRPIVGHCLQEREIRFTQIDFSPIARNSLFLARRRPIPVLTSLLCSRLLPWVSHNTRRLFPSHSPPCA